MIQIVVLGKMDLKVCTLLPQGHWFLGTIARFLNRKPHIMNIKTDFVM